MADIVPEGQEPATTDHAAAPEEVEPEPDVDVILPSRRRRASDDEGEGDEFHDAASDQTNQTAARGDQGAAAEAHDGAASDQNLSTEGSEAGDAAEGAEAEGGEAIGGEGADDSETGEAQRGEGEIAHEDADADRVPGKKAIRSREPFEVPTGGAFWLHDDRFGGEAEQEPAEEAKDEREGGKSKADADNRWSHDKFAAIEAGLEVADDDEAHTWGRGGRGGRSGGGGGRGGRGGRGPGGGMREGGMRGGGRSSYSEGQAALPTTVTHTSRRPRRPDMQSADDFPSLGGHSNGGASHSAAAPRPRRGASSERVPRVEGAAGGRGAGSRGASDRAGGAAVPAAAGPVYVPLARVTGSGGRGDRSSASGQSRPHPYGSEYAADMGGGRGRGGGSRPVRSYEASSASERGSHGLPRDIGDRAGRGARPGGRDATRQPTDYLAQNPRHPASGLAPTGPRTSTRQGHTYLDRYGKEMDAADEVEREEYPTLSAANGPRRYTDRRGGGGEGGLAANGSGPNNRGAYSSSGPSSSYPAGSNQQHSRTSLKPLSAAAATFEPGMQGGPGGSRPGRSGQNMAAGGRGRGFGRGGGYGASAAEMAAHAAADFAHQPAPPAPQPTISSYPGAKQSGPPGLMGGAAVGNAQSAQSTAAAAYGSQPQGSVFVPSVNPPPPGMQAQQQAQQQAAGGTPGAAGQQPPGPMMQPGQPGQPLSEMEQWFQEAYQRAISSGMEPQQAYSTVQAYAAGMQAAYAQLSSMQSAPPPPGGPMQPPPQQQLTQQFGGPAPSGMMGGPMGQGPSQQPPGSGPMSMSKGNGGFMNLTPMQQQQVPPLLPQQQFAPPPQQMGPPPAQQHYGGPPQQQQQYPPQQQYQYSA